MLEEKVYYSRATFSDNMPSTQELRVASEAAALRELHHRYGARPEFLKADVYTDPSRQKWVAALYTETIVIKHALRGIEQQRKPGQLLYHIKDRELSWH